MTRSASRRMSRADWLTLGMAQASADGVDALGLERICAAANKTRGSFYHHFADHDVFLAAVAEAWRDLYTVQVIERLKARFGDQATGLGSSANDVADALLEDILGLDMQLEGAMRRLAEVSAAAAAEIKKADAERIECLVELHAMRAIGTARRQSIDIHGLAELEYAAFIGAITLWPDGSSDQRRRLESLFRAMVAAYIARLE